MHDFQNDYRYLCPDGKIIWLRYRLSKQTYWRPATATEKVRQEIYQQMLAHVADCGNCKVDPRFKRVYRVDQGLSL